MRTQRARCHPASLSPADGTKNEASLKVRARGTGLLQPQPSCPGRSLQREEGGRLAGSYVLLSTPEHSPIPAHVCSDHSAVLPSPPRSSPYTCSLCARECSARCQLRSKRRKGLAAPSPRRDLGTSARLWDGAGPVCHLLQPCSHSAPPRSGHPAASPAKDASLLLI